MIWKKWTGGPIEILTKNQKVKERRDSTPKRVRIQGKKGEGCKRKPETKKGDAQGETAVPSDTHREKKRRPRLIKK